ncbi:hypothetical protein C8R44DRAFT_927238 [Mycena epipterygia]|nr:hypothetical protein C8R44DRAFT_927238 [Mycena epipterygia]
MQLGEIRGFARNKYVQIPRTSEESFTDTWVVAARSEDREEEKLGIASVHKADGSCTRPASVDCQFGIRDYYGQGGQWMNTTGERGCRRRKPAPSSNSERNAGIEARCTVDGRALSGTPVSTLFYCVTGELCRGPAPELRPPSLVSPSRGCLLVCEGEAAIRPELLLRAACCSTHRALPPRVLGPHAENKRTLRYLRCRPARNRNAPVSQQTQSIGISAPRYLRVLSSGCPRTAQKTQTHPFFAKSNSLLVRREEFLGTGVITTSSFGHPKSNVHPVFDPIPTWLLRH